MLQDVAFCGNPSGFGLLGQSFRISAAWENPSGICILGQSFRITPFGEILHDFSFGGNPSGFCLLEKSFRMLPLGKILQDSTFWEDTSGVCLLGRSFRMLPFGRIFPVQTVPDLSPGLDRSNARPYFELYSPARHVGFRPAGGQTLE